MLIEQLELHARPHRCPGRVVLNAWVVSKVFLCGDMDPIPCTERVVLAITLMVKIEQLSFSLLTGHGSFVIHGVWQQLASQNDADGVLQLLARAASSRQVL